MKATLCLVFACAILALVMCEPCSHVSDCSHTSCDSSTNLGCSHGECTCLGGANPGSCSSTSCSQRSDCDSCTCRDHRARHHCFDGHCMCGFGAFPGVGK